MLVESHPRLLASTMAYTKSITDAVTSRAPNTSTPSRTPAPGRSSINDRPSNNAATPIGTLMKKIQCQLTACVKAPPTSRPIAPPEEATKA